MTDPGPLSELVGAVGEKVEAGHSISIGLIQEVAGRRSAGPLLVFPALLAMSPLTIVPGVASFVGLCTVIVASQIAAGREQVWLPNWLKNITPPKRQSERLLKFLKPVGEQADQVVQERAVFLTSWPLRRAGAAVCALIGLAMPITELVPFSATWCGAAIAAYALAITVRDGLLALAWACLVIGLLLVAAALFL